MREKQDFCCCFLKQTIILDTLLTCRCDIGWSQLIILIGKTDNYKEELQNEEFLSSTDYILTMPNTTEVCLHMKARLAYPRKQLIISALISINHINASQIHFLHPCAL